MAKHLRNPSTRLTDIDNVGEIELQSHRDAKDRDIRQRLARKNQTNLPPPTVTLEPTEVDTGEHKKPSRVTIEDTDDVDEPPRTTKTGMYPFSV
jgi:hypothetical protein